MLEALDVRIGREGCGMTYFHLSGGFDLIRPSRP